MTRGKVRIIAHRRRREGRTDYRQRLALIKSEKPRFVVRRSVNSLTCQFIQHDSKGDRTLISVSSRNLDNFGWVGPRGNLPGAYLTGLLCGSLATRKGVKKAVLDIGLHASTKGSRIYSALKGCLDAGIDIPHSADILPPVERMRGLHIESYSEKRKEVAKIFDEVKKHILSGKKPISKKTVKKPTPAKKFAKKNEPSKKTVKKPARKAVKRPAKKASPAKPAKKPVKKAKK